MTNVSEQARETATSVCAAICMLLGDLRLTQTDVFETACSEIEPALTVAASEARAAAIEQCIGTLDGYKQGIIDNEDYPDQDAELVNTLDSAIHMLRALATPAQSEGK